jgi:hypothetical protein
MVQPQDEKQRIVLELAHTRNHLVEQSLLVRRNLDIGRHMSDSMREHSWGWMCVAAIFGWILSRLPARKKKVYIQSAKPQKLDKKRGGGGLLKLVWNGAWSIAKPLLTAYLTKKIAEKAKIPGSKWL